MDSNKYANIIFVLGQTPEAYSFIRVGTKPTVPIFKSSSDASIFEISATDLSGSIKDSLEF